MIQTLIFLFWLSMFFSQSLMDLMATVLACTALVEVFRERKVSGQWPCPPKPITFFFLTWIVILGVGLFVIAPPEAPRWKNFLEFRWMLELALWVFILRKHPLSWRQLSWFLIPPLSNAIFGLGTFVVGSSPLLPGEAIDRVGGFFNSPMPFAHSMGPVVAVLFGLMLVVGWKDQRIQRTILPLLLLIGVSVLLTKTRGIWAGCLVASIVLPLAWDWRRGWKLSSLITVVSIAVVMGIPTLRERVTQTFDPARSYDNQRFVLWSTNWEMFKDHPLVGLGYSENGRRLPEYYQRLQIPADQFKSHAHNQYLHFLSGTGLLGLTCYLIFLGYFLRQTWRLIHQPTLGLWWRGLALGLLGAQIVFEIGSVTEANFSVAKNRAVLLFLFAAVMSIKAWATAESATPVPPPKN